MEDSHVPEDDGEADSGRSSIDYRQVSFVLVAVVGLAVAAFLAPPVTDQEREPESETDGGRLSVSDSLADLLRRLFNFGGNGEPACQIILRSEPVPGDDVTVTVRNDGEPVTDGVVWFSGERIGRTNEDGRVTGEVPYTRRLKIRVDAPSLSGCRATTGTDRRFQGTTGASADRLGLPTFAPGVRPVFATASAPDALLAAGSGSVPTTGQVRSRSTVAQEDGGSATYPIDAAITIAVRGRPYPGETVTIDAEIQGVPVREGTVTVAGKTVGTTDENGQLQIEIPDQDTVPVVVSKGDFSRKRTIDALKLQPTLESESLLLVPQEDATVIATRADERVAQAVVRVDGERVGTTNAGGKQAVVLPLDPTAAVTVSTDRQTASVSLFDIYWLPAALAVVFVSVLSGSAYRVVGWPGPLAIVGVSVALLTTLLVEAYVGDTASLLTLVGYAAVGLLVGLYIKRSRAAEAASEATGLFTRVFRWLVTTALQLTNGIEPLLDRLGALASRFVAWLRALPRSTSALLGRFVAWLGTLPGRIADVVTRSSPAPRTVGLGVVVLLLPVGGYLLDGLRGAGLAVLVLLFASTGWWYANREPAEPDETDATDEPTRAPGSTSDTTAGQTTPKTLRELWRQFARQVVPGRWRTRSPAEIGRVALQKGYPDRPVRELTDTFREVEYGNRSLSDAVTERVRTAYQALSDDETEPDEGQASIGTKRAVDAAAGDTADRPAPERRSTESERDAVDDPESNGDLS